MPIVPSFLMFILNRMCFCFLESIFVFCHFRYRYCLHCDYRQKHRLCLFLEISCCPCHFSTDCFHHNWYGYHQTSGLALFRACYWNECFHCNNILLFQIFTSCFNVRGYIQFVCFNSFIISVVFIIGFVSQTSGGIPFSELCHNSCSDRTGVVWKLFK